MNERVDQRSRSITLFLCGDVMTGRGIDQVLPHPSEPTLHEDHVHSALEYVELAEQRNGPISKPVAVSYIWGDAAGELERVKPDVRIVNLETSITTSEDYEPKGINYRMHPDNTPCLVAAKIDCCVLANNHVLDWGYAGLAETLTTLHGASMRTAGAGENLAEALEPAIIGLPNARVLVFAYGMSNSGVPCEWAATHTKPGIALLSDFSETQLGKIAESVHAMKRPGDIAVLSIHWGPNWGYGIPTRQRAFAHRVIDAAGIDIVHGHSSHHPKPLEVYNDKPILYGCGDFLNDYEGISGYEEFHSHLVLMYFVTLDSTGKLLRLEMTPLEMKRFRLQRVEHEDAVWLRDTLNRKGRRIGTELMLLTNDQLVSPPLQR